MSPPQLVNNQDEIHVLDKILWEKYVWKHLSLIGDETVINEVWKNRVAGVRSEKSYRDFDGINGEPTDFEWNIFPGFTTLQFCDKINDLLSDLGQTPETFTGRILFMSMFNDISCDRKGNKDESLAMPNLRRYLREDLVLDNGLLLDQVLKRNGILPRTVHKEPGTTLQSKCLLEFAESGHPTFRATTPLSRGNLKSKGRGKLSIHFAADQETIETIYRIILSVNQLSVYGAAAATCEEFEGHQDRSGELEILMGQSIVLGEVKAETPLQNRKSHE